MATQSSDMLHPVSTRTSPAQAHPTAATSTARTLRALTGNEATRGLKLAAADAPEPERHHEDNKDDEAAWLPGGDEAAAATDTVSSAGAETAAASSITGGASAAGTAAEATAGASSAPAGSSLFAGLTANPELTVGAILGTVTLGAAMTGKSPYDGSAESAPAPAPLASGAGQQRGPAVDGPATGNRGSEATGNGASTGSVSNTASGSGTAASTGAGAGAGAAAGSSSGAGAASGSHASSDAGHVGAAGTEGSAANAGGSGAPGGAAGGAATSPGTGHGTDPAHTQSLNYGANENKAVGAAIFNGASPQDTPEYIRITSIRGKNAGTVNGLMTLENGEEITVGQVISRADFERIFWNASKSDGSFSFVPVKDAQGTAIPNTVEQTVIIKTPESTKPGSTTDTPAGESGNAGHDTTSQTGSGAGTATASNAGTPSSTGSSHGTGADSAGHAGTGTTGSGSGSGSADHPLPAHDPARTGSRSPASSGTAAVRAC
jgi:fibroin heavy chain